jgi:Holliday junction resolvase-like predicted endonuclease
MMTDDELKALVAKNSASIEKLAESHDRLQQEGVDFKKKLDQEVADFKNQLDQKVADSKRQLDLEMAESKREWRREIAEIHKKITEAQDRTDIQLKETDAQIKETAAQLRKTDAQLEKTDAQLRKTDAKLDKLGALFGGSARNQGEVVEEFFYNSLETDLMLNGIQFDSIERNIHRKSKRLQGEYDILLVNGKEVFIIEVKYKAHRNDLKHLIEKKAVHFKELFPVYQDFKQHLGLASFHVNENLKRESLENGVTVLQRKGDLIETTPPPLTPP